MGKKKKAEKDITANLEKILQALTSAYLLLLFGVLPLYMEDGFALIGNAKYHFFQSISIALLPIGAMVWAFRELLVRKHRKDQPLQALPIDLSFMDCLVLSYGAVNILSCLCSSQKETALWGFFGWYMGLFSQLIFVSIYFFISRWYDGNVCFWVCSGGAAALVMFIGVLNRIGIDLLQTYAILGKDDWNSLHLMSTIGNNNWYAGYISVTAGFGLAAFYCCNGWKRMPGLLGSLIYFATALTQGSIIGVAASFGMVFTLFLISLGDSDRMLRALETALLLPAANILLRIYVRLGITGLVLESDESSHLLFHGGWYLFFTVLAAACLLLRWRNAKRGPAARDTAKVFLLLLIPVILGLVTFGMGFDWQSVERFQLWAASVRGYGAMNFWAKLIGVGPDCFFHAMYEMTSFGAQVGVQGMWEEAVYSNAHNEWLTLLINQGLLGFLLFAGMFSCFYWRSRRQNQTTMQSLSILLGVTGYLICSLSTFQHVMSTPFLFALFGLAEHTARKDSGT